MQIKALIAVALILPALVSCKTPASSEPKPQLSEKALPAGIDVNDIPFKGSTYRVITVDTSAAQLRLSSHISTNGQVHNLESLKKQIELEGHTLSFAVNAGMFHKNMEPVGLYVENSKTFSPINLDKGAGNFFFKPNGYFAITANGPVVNVSEKWDPAIGARFATQSGPMLVIDGAIHPKFEPKSLNLNIRNGVCVTANRYVHLAISLNTVRFYDFADFFKRSLGCANALYLDGQISQTYVRRLYESHRPQEFGTFIFAE